MTKWKLVPVEPTPEMVDQLYVSSPFPGEVWKDLLKHAPNPLDDAELEERVARSICLCMLGIEPGTEQEDWIPRPDYWREFLPVTRAVIAAMTGG